MFEKDSISNARYQNFRTYKRREIVVSSRVAPRNPSAPLISDFAPKTNAKLAKTRTYKPSTTTGTTRQSNTHTQLPKKPSGTPLYTAPKKKLAKLRNNWRTAFAPKYMLPAMATSLFLIGIGVSLQGFYNNKQAAEAQDRYQGNVASATSDEEKPDETEPTEQVYRSYQVAPDLPRYVRINKIGLGARVQRIGIKANGQLQAPGNIYNVGWYENSAKPGDAGGATVIDGHVHGPTRPGAFNKLKHVSEGDVVEIERGDGQVISYKVVGKESMPTNQVNMAKALVSADTSKAGLTLITCDGKYNKQTDDYENRLMVFAVRI